MSTTTQLYAQALANEAIIQVLIEDNRRFKETLFLINRDHPEVIGGLPSVLREFAEAMINNLVWEDDAEPS